MTNQELNDFIKTIRKTAREKGINPVTLEKLKEVPSVSKELLAKYVKSNDELVNLILENERQQLEEILKKYDENRKETNAIDLLFNVSKDIADNFHNLSPALVHQYQELYPDIYKDHFDKKAEFVFQRISGNLRDGKWQGVYRDDVSEELVARVYISRLVDMYNPDSFPAKDLSFSKVFIQMFENFVKSIATEKGLQYWENKKSEYNINF